MEDLLFFVFSTPKFFIEIGWNCAEYTLNKFDGRNITAGSYGIIGTCGRTDDVDELRVTELCVYFDRRTTRKKNNKTQYAN